MAPQKRALDQTDANVQPPSKRRSAGGPSAKETENSANDGEHSENPASAENDTTAQEATSAGTTGDPIPLSQKKDDDYICMYRSLFDFEAEWRNEADEEEEGDEDDDDENDSEDEEGDSAFRKYKKATEESKGICDQLAADHPSWKWVIMVESMKKLMDLRRDQYVVDPDKFGMYVFNDMEAYGFNNLVENIIVEFDKEYRKKKDRSLKHMWAIMAALGHWLNYQDTMTIWIAIDDGARADAFVGVVGCAFLSLLDALDEAGHLKQGSEFLDLGLVMSLYLEWFRGLEDYGIGQGDEDSSTSWRPSIVAYAKRAGIDLNATGCYSVRKDLEEFEDVAPLKQAKVGRWQWNKKLKDFRGEHGFPLSSQNFGIPSFDITKWPRTLRAKYAFDNVDPLADIPEKELKEGNIVFG